MARIKSISTSDPCHENWKQMTVVEQGRYCQSCCKTVTDFTGMSNAQIIKHLSIKDNVCGRLYYTQIESIKKELSSDNKSIKWKGFIAAASIISLISVSKVYAKAKASYNTDQAPFKQHDPLQKDTLYKTITGTITTEDTVRLAQTYICVKGTAIKTLSNEKGEFTLNVPVNADTLEILWVPYTKQYVKIDPANQSNYNIKYKSIVDTAAINRDEIGKVYLGEIKTKPGKRFNKALLIKTAKEIGKLGEFK